MTVATHDIKFFNAQDLINDPTFLAELLDLVNRSYSHPPKGQAKTEGFRFDDAAEMLARLGSGTCAVLFIEGVPVATASLIPWKGDSMDTDDFELSTVACPPEWRQNGLAEASCAAVEEVVVAQRSANPDSKNVRLWLLCGETRAAPYWKRKGFVETERRIVPAGTWGMAHDFAILTMCRPARKSA
ncbi:hypothetical protein IWX90DRAFT_165588 [Phyllosticta citrichinensis]|uniref:N-acetyltransferase domain-containing protein n=1 Tax=Phyllosticta citrichinensis TaxID=1130410 RepID=A0ABR1Y0T0_9PEZI